MVIGVIFQGDCGTCRRLTCTNRHSVDIIMVINHVQLNHSRDEEHRSASRPRSQAGCEHTEVHAQNVNTCKYTENLHSANLPSQRM